jgi:hypothetical protein
MLLLKKYNCCVKSIVHYGPENDPKLPKMSSSQRVKEGKHVLTTN